MGLLEIVPNADAKCLLVREEHVAFRALSMIDHDVDHVAGLHAHCASRILKLFDGNEALGLVPEVYDDFLGSDLEYSPLKDFSLGWGSEVTVILEQVLVVLFSGRNLRVDLFPIFVAGHSASPLVAAIPPIKLLIAQHIRKIPE